MSEAIHSKIAVSKGGNRQIRARAALVKNALLTIASKVLRILVSCNCGTDGGSACCRRSQVTL